MGSQHVLPLKERILASPTSLCRSATLTVPCSFKEGQLTTHTRHGKVDQATTRLKPKATPCSDVFESLKRRYPGQCLGSFNLHSLISHHRHLGLEGVIAPVMWTPLHASKTQPIIYTASFVIGHLSIIDSLSPSPLSKSSNRTPQQSAKLIPRSINAVRLNRIQRLPHRARSVVVLALPLLCKPNAYI